MRNLTHNIMTAFLEGRPLKLQNTRTDGNTVFLHGHAIIRRHGTGFDFTLAGWNTATTRERINGFLDIIGSPYGVSQMKFNPYLHSPDGSRPLSSTEWVSIPGSRAKLAARTREDPPHPAGRPGVQAPATGEVPKKSLK